jgi:flavin-dependent dehydrogenase
MQTYDIVVVGAGPAGATAAFTGARAGYRTAIVEKANLHRPKICGGLVTGPSAELIRRIFRRDIAAEALVDPGILSVYLIPPSGIEEAFPQPHKRIYNVSRERFDGWLTDQAVAAGAEPFGNTALLGLEQRPEGVLLHTKGPRGPESILTRYVVGADGVYSRVRRSIRPDYPNAITSVVQDYFADEGKFEPYFYVFLKKTVSPCYAYVVPKDGYTMLGTGRIQGLEPELEAGMYNLRAWLRKDFGFEARSFSYREGWSVPFGSVCYGSEDVVLIGDAGGFCHPFTAEGILFGVQAGGRIPECIDAAERESVPLSEAFRALFSAVGDSMLKARDYVMGLDDHELSLLAREKRAAMAQAFGWDAEEVPKDLAQGTQLHPA